MRVAALLALGLLAGLAVSRTSDAIMWRRAVSLRGPRGWTVTVGRSW